VINLSSQLPTITEGLTITGPEANLLTLDAGGGTDGTVGTGDGFRIFELNDGMSGFNNRIDVQLSGMTLTGGDSAANGGAIENGGETLTLIAVAIVDNAANTGGGVDNFNAR